MIWSGVDGVYISQVRELPGCIADGATPEEALQNIRIVMQEWVDTAKEEGREIPPPVSLEMLEQKAEVAQRIVAQQLENHVRKIVEQILEKTAEQQAAPNIPSWRESGVVRFEGALEKSR